MTLKLTPDPDNEAVERCAFCRKRTKYWYTLKDVAVCVGCGSVAEPEDVPSKKTWLRREDIAFKGLPFSVRMGLR